MGTRSKVCCLSKGHFSSKSLIQCVAVGGFQSSSNEIAVTFERKPSTFSWRSLEALEQHRLGALKSLTLQRSSRKKHKILGDDFRV